MFSIVLMNTISKIIRITCGNNQANVLKLILGPQYVFLAMNILCILLIYDNYTCIL